MPVTYQREGAEFGVNTTTAGDQYVPVVAAHPGGGYAVASMSPGTGDVYMQHYDDGGQPASSEMLVRLSEFGATYPSIAILAGRGIVVTWTSSAGSDGSGTAVLAHLYHSDGRSLGEVQVNTTTAGDQKSPSVTPLHDGGYVIVWQSYNQDGSFEGIYAQRYDDIGSAQGPETRVNTTTTDVQMDPSVTALSDGGYVVVWQSNNQDGGG